MKKILPLLLAVFAIALASARAETIFGLTSGNRILVFDSATPGTVISEVTVTGLQNNELLLGIDFRPFTGGLYALGSTNRLYVIDINSGSAKMVGSAGAFQLMGGSFGFDFNPTVDRIRVTSDEEQNLRLNPITGAIAATDTPLAYAVGDVNAAANPNIVGSAYSNNIAGAASTVLYDIDSNLDILAIQNPPNNGTLNTVGTLSVDAMGSVGFDISSITGVAYASFVRAPGTGGAELYTINLSSGIAVSLGVIADAARLAGSSIVDIAVPTPTRLLNLSTRGRVGQANDVLIGGFIAGGYASSKFVLRGIGPSLPSSAVGTPLADPVLTLVDSNGTMVKTNDDYATSSATDLAQITGNNLTPSSALESAIFASLNPGAYTAILSGKNGGMGVGLVEVYQIP